MARLDQSMLQENYGDYDFKGTNYLAQTFQAGITGQLFQIQLNLKKVGAPDNFIVEIRDIVSGHPGSTILASQEVSNALVGESHAVITVIFSQPCSMVAGTSYAIVLHIKNDTGDSGNQYFNYGIGEDTYLNGMAGVSSNSGTSWTMVDWLDMYFATYVTFSPLPTFFRS